MKLLLVEDETDLASAIEKGLKKCNYAVDVAYDGEEALEYYKLYDYDLIILDLNLPIIDGLDVLKYIRNKNKEIKIIILSARAKIEQRVEGLNLGANDYLIKPFDFLELEARINALLRISFAPKSSVLTCGELIINTATKTVTLSNQEVHFTKKEYSLLEYLFMHINEVVANEELIEHIWDSDAELYLSSLKYHIHSIKKKLCAINLACQFIKNVRGHGYMITEEDN